MSENTENTSAPTETAASTTTATTTTSSEPRRYNNYNNRGDDNNSNNNRTPFRERKKYFRKKVCYFCKNNQDVVDYKDVKLLRRYMKESGKIIPKRLNGSCSKHQRMIASAIKRARNIALLPFETRY